VLSRHACCLLQVQRDARHVMLFSIMTVTDEINRPARKCRVNTHLGMTYLTFLEALCRLAASHGCPPDLPLSVQASDAAAAESELQRKLTSAGSGVVRGKKRTESGVRGESRMRATTPAERSRSPSGASRRRAASPLHAVGSRRSRAGDAADFGRSGAFGSRRPEAPVDLPSRIELLLVHVGVVEGYNIANCRRPPPEATSTHDPDDSALGDVS
jgi:hypothetical protein